MRFPLNKLLAEHLLTQFRGWERSPESQDCPVDDWTAVDKHSCPQELKMLPGLLPDVKWGDLEYKFLGNVSLYNFFKTLLSCISADTQDYSLICVLPGKVVTSGQALWAEHTSFSSQTSFVIPAFHLSLGLWVVSFHAANLCNGIKQIRTCRKWLVLSWGPLMVC